MYLPSKKRNQNLKIPIVIEFGHLNTRAGFAGLDVPNIILPSDYAVD